MKQHQKPKRDRSEAAIKAEHFADWLQSCSRRQIALLKRNWKRHVTKEGMFT
jgi:hypothetical protein